MHPLTTLALARERHAFLLEEAQARRGRVSGLRHSRWRALPRLFATADLRRRRHASASPIGGCAEA